ncbi:MAG TPA: hypothetical protein VIL26_07555 [Clostridia bacterium]
MKIEKMLVFIFPCLLVGCFLYLLIWLDFSSALPYLIMLVFTLSVAFLQLLLIKSNQTLKIIIIIKYLLLFIVSAFYTIMYTIAGPAGNDSALIVLILLQFITTISTIPLCILELKYLL